MIVHDFEMRMHVPVQQWKGLTVPSHEMLSVARCTARAYFTCTRLCCIGSARRTVTGAPLVSRSFADQQSQRPRSLWGSAYDFKRSFITPKHAFAGSLASGRIGVARTIVHAFGANPAAAGQPLRIYINKQTRSDNSSLKISMLCCRP